MAFFGFSPTLKAQNSSLTSSQQQTGSSAPSTQNPQAVTGGLQNPSGNLQQPNNSLSGLNLVKPGKLKVEVARGSGGKIEISADKDSKNNSQSNGFPWGLLVTAMVFLCAGAYFTAKYRRQNKLA